MPKISIIYHIYKNTTNLKNSLNSILNLSDLNSVELIIFDDYATDEVLKIINLEHFKQIKNIKYISSAQNLGHAYSYNLGTKISAADYVYFAGSECVFNKDFVKNILNFSDLYANPDILVFKNNLKNDLSKKNKIDLTKNNVFNHLSADLVYESENNISNKVFKREFLIKNKLEMVENHFYPAVFILDVLAKAKKIVFIEEQLIQFIKNPKPSFNLYDLLFQIEEFYEIKKRLNLSNREYDKVLEFWAIKIGFYEFIDYVIKSNLTDEEKILAINVSYKLLIKIYPKYQSNENIKLIKEKKWRDFFIKFKPKLSWIKNSLTDK